MNDTEKTNDEKEAPGEDWAVLPFDEQADEGRWDKLINETDDLAKRAAAIDWDDDEISNEEILSDDGSTENEQSLKNEDDDIANMNPF